MQGFVQRCKGFGMTVMDQKFNPKTDWLPRDDKKPGDSNKPVRPGKKDRALGKKPNNSGVKCFKCGRFPLTANAPEGRQPHSAADCFLTNHTDANKDSSKQYSDTKAFHEMKKQYPCGVGS